ncbi:MAG: TonB-dependent receptor [gamma proteobacterium symbiont of Taylorina sp.]|nr:TonB-dependent receptor [gamma proteobacterium symbiont of Taylorina sp.]
MRIYSLCFQQHYSLHFILLVLCFSIFTTTAYSLEVDEVTTTELYEMNLDQLINLEVSVASINTETILETAAIVSSYNTEDLEKTGLRTLREMLSFIPGLSLQSSNNPTDSIMVRGVSETFNQKILLLIDDVPYWGSSHSQIPLLGLPLEAIERIEVIRGPGAVIYGTNASAGVVKIVTKNASADNTLAFRTGSHQHNNAGGFYTQSFSDSSDLSIAFEVQNEDGYEGFFENSVKLPYLPDDQKTSGSIREKMEMKSILAKLRFDNLNLMAQVFESHETGSLGAAPTHPAKPAEAENNGYLLHADYLWDLEKATLKAYTDYNVSYFEAYEKDYLPGVERLVKFPDEGANTYRWRSGLTINHHFSDNFSAFAGSEYEYRSVGDYDMFIGGEPVLRQLEEQDVNEVSVFGQLDYNIDDFRFLLGARYTDNENAGSAITPRASVIYSIDQLQSIKLLYSEGFNSPNFLQTSVDLPFIGGKIDLEAEKIQTFDIAYTYANNNNLFVLNAYRLEAKDFITRVAGETRPTYDNSGAFTRHGLEVDLQHRQGDWTAFINAAYLVEGNSKDDDDPEAYHAPKFTGNIALHYDLFEDHGIGSSLRYIGSRSGINHSLTWNIDYQYQYKNIELFATIKNLLNEEVFSRDMAGFSPEPVPVSDPDRNFLVGIKYHF